MKEVTIWDNRPREMWVWDYDFERKERVRVVYLCDVDKVAYPVVTLSEDTAGNLIVKVFKHCAEIEEPKTRRMTNKELAWWLREKPTREYKYIHDMHVYSYFSYTIENANCPVPKGILVRENGSEWREPIVETDEYKDYLESEKAYNDGV